MILASLTPATGPLLVATALLALAGAGKLRRPAPTGLALARLGLPGGDGVVRALGAVELVVAAAATLAGGVLAGPVALLYVGFAAVSAVQVRRARRTGEAADCGCFGDSSAPVGGTHVAVDLLLALGAGLAATTGADGVVGGLGDAPVATVAVLALAALAAWGVQGLLTDLPRLRALRELGEATS